MVAWWWSWLLTAVGVTGFYFAGSGKTYGWVIGIYVQILWISYAVVTKQWGFIASALVYGAVHVRNTIRWRRIDRAKKEAKVV